MKDFTVMLIGDETAPVRRIHIPRQSSQRALIAGCVLVALLVVGVWDYWRLRADNRELSSLRVEAAEQREQIRVFEDTLGKVEADLAMVKELERKVRIIANLPGAAAAGGAAVTELAPAVPGRIGEPPAADEPMVPVGVPLEPNSTPPAPSAVPVSASEVRWESAADTGLESAGARELVKLGGVAELLFERSKRREGSLDELVSQLDDKRRRLVSMPSIWPSRGWLTSRYGYRISPFTGKRQRHSGIDIAAKPGTKIIAPAKGRVHYVGSKGPLGKTVVLDHGFGVRTLYGHTSEILVKIGDSVGRGQQIAAVGTSGRSTGPHLHYVVEVNGRTRDPLNYIFD